jgi:hypothetical protein
MAQLSQFRNSSNGATALTAVKPDTLSRWRRKGFRLFWKLKSRFAGRQRCPARFGSRSVKCRENNATWGEERITGELVLKIGIQISREQFGAICRLSQRIPAHRWTRFDRKSRSRKQHIVTD